MTLNGAPLVQELHRRFVTINDDVRIGDHEVNLVRPRSAEDLISEPDFERDERLPYWAELWPSSTVLASFIVDHDIAATRGIELGCGIGLVSIAATIAGHDMLATDYYDDALAFARANTYRNVGRELSTRSVDWRHMPDDLGTFDLVLASDVLYEAPYAEIVASAIDATLSPTGRAYVADPGRVAASKFLDACTGKGMRIEAKSNRAYLAGKIRQTITIYEIARS